ncbi:hypothetical protein NPIL_387701 [Nephila pilipes]|uniref:Uncharacterized protein n=1 Tax=Nephila pilipes TaxID=299642 RepID=A0A8X6N3V5_NEPPI|nr:hypothetical protein NPIL_387701 [Nephila pilipes]
MCEKQLDIGLWQKVPAFFEKEGCPSEGQRHQCPSFLKKGGCPSEGQSHQCPSFLKKGVVLLKVKDILRECIQDICVLMYYNFEFLNRASRRLDLSSSL